jgi:hypothetical protein
VQFVLLQVPERVQGDGLPAGALGAVAQRDLLGHGAGGKEDRGLGAQQLRHALFERGHRPVAVVVGLAVQQAGGVEVRQPFAHGRGPRAGKDAVTPAQRGHPALPCGVSHRAIVAERREPCGTGTGGSDSHWSLGVRRSTP